MSNTTTAIINERDKLAKRFADACAALRTDKTEAASTVNAVFEPFLKGLRRGTQKVADAEAALKTFIADHPELYQDGAKTETIYGIKTGFIKARDTIAPVDSEDSAIAAIKALGPKKMALYVRVKQELDKTTLNKCTDDELAAMGLQRVYGGDEVVVKQDDSDIAKMLAIISPATKEVM